MKIRLQIYSRLFKAENKLLAWELMDGFFFRLVSISRSIFPMRNPHHANVKELRIDIVGFLFPILSRDKIFNTSFPQESSCWRWWSAVSWSLECRRETRTFSTHPGGGTWLNYNRRLHLIFLFIPICLFILEENVLVQFIILSLLDHFPIPALWAKSGE